KLERQLPDPKIDLQLSAEQNPSIRDTHVAEATVWTKGPVLRARESSQDVRASIDQLVDKLERQVTRYREKRGRRRRPGRPAPVDPVLNFRRQYDTAAGALAGAGLPPRARRWDAIVTAEAPDVDGNEVAFVTLPDGSLLVEEEKGNAALDPLAQAVEGELTPPYRVHAVRQTERLWAVSALRI